MNVKKQLMDGLIHQNPVTVQLLGMCSVMAISTTLFNGIGMGLSVLVILTCANIVIALLSIAQLVLVLVLIVKGFTLYQNTSNSGFGSRFVQAFASECKAFGHAITSLFTGGSGHKPSAGK